MPQLRPLFRYDDAMRRLANKRAVLDRAVEIFRQQTPGQLQAIRDAVLRNDADALEGLLHSLRGACVTIEAGRMADAIRRMETLLREERIAEMRPLAEDLARTYEETMQAIDDALARHPA